MQSIGHKPGLSLISILIFLVSTARTQFCDEFEQKGDNTYGLQFKDYYLLFIATHMWKLEYNAKDQTFRFGHTPEDSNHKVELFSGTLANWRFGITSWLKLSTRNKNDRHLMTGMLSKGEKFEWRKLDEYEANRFVNFRENTSVRRTVTTLSNDLAFFENLPPKVGFNFYLNSSTDCLHCFIGNIRLPDGNLSRAFQCDTFETVFYWGNLNSIRTINKTDVVIDKLKSKMNEKNINSDSVSILLAEDERSDQLFLIFGVENYSRFAFFYKDEQSITYCFTDDILFNRGCMADTLKTLISCSAPTTITPPTTRTNPTTSTIPSDEQTSLPEKQTSRPEKSSNGTTTKVQDTTSTTQSTTSKGSVTPTVVTPEDESNVIAWVVLFIVVLLFIVVIAVGFYFYYSKKLKKRAKKRQNEEKQDKEDVPKEEETKRTPTDYPSGDLPEEEGNDSQTKVDL